MSGIACLWIGFLICLIVATVDWRRYRKRTLITGAVMLTAAALLSLVVFVASMNRFAGGVR
jgi:hypothetical protein